ncbi:MAG: hypothetical protein JO318_01585 [Chloroflexi bacterium]|nr:hypothetical protein [Chloroflexota bacterium]MBV9131357.1 hypothetical protein [Chloroflexota bacterium]
MQAEAVADDVEQLRLLIKRSPLLPESALRRHWQNVLEWLPPAARYELADILLSFENR